MTKEELIKEATEYALEWGEKTDGTYAYCRDGYLAAAEPREKRIEELEAINKTISNECHKLVDSLEKKQNEVAELQHLIKTQDRKLRQQSKVCDEAIDRVETLVKENTELKSELTKKADTNHSLVEQMADLESKNAELEKKNTALRQDWEIMKNTIADYNDFCDKYMKLEKENAELKERNRELLESCEGATMMYKDLYKAKEIIRMVIDSYNHKERFSFEKDLMKAEQFLKEVEK